MRATGVTRFGINLGSWTFWGAEQLSSNILKNPGLEGLIDGAIAVPAHANASSFDDHPGWLARPDGFWDGAHYSIRAGRLAGAGGTIQRSAQKNLWGLPSFVVRDGGPVPDIGDAVALQKNTADALPEQWWFSKDSGSSFAPELRQKRPGSPGVRSLRITAGSAPVEVASYFDSIGSRAGKLLPLTGRWTLSFWTKLDQGSAAMDVSFGRDGSAPILSRKVALSGAWTNIQLEFTGDDDGPPNAASLRFRTTGLPAGQVLLDDIDLRREEDCGRPFRQEVVSALKRLRPAYLRDWQGQLGDTLENRISPAFARKSYRYRPGPQTDFGYGLRDLFDLAIEVGASPWIIIPTTFSDEECSALGAYLVAQKAFPEILVEFGNENWNETFRPGAIADASAHGQAADRCFAAVRSHAPGVQLKTVINAPYVSPERTMAFTQASSGANVVAVAPYYLYSVSKGLPLAGRIASLFPRPIALPRTPVELAVYEVNASALDGTASAEERKPVLAGIASGTALAKTMLDLLASGVRRQCAYSLAGFDAALPNQSGYVPLFGMVRDLGPTRRFRPTGLALELLNQVVDGDMQSVEQRGPSDVSVYGFHSAKGWSAAILSGSGVQRTVAVRFPRGAAAQRLLRLSAPSLEATNEDNERVRIVAEGTPFSDHEARIVLDPWSMAVLLP